MIGYANDAWLIAPIRNIADKLVLGDILEKRNSQIKPRKFLINLSLF